MMVETAIDPKQLEREFYSRPYYMSYSALKKLLYAPMSFYTHYVLKQQEERMDKHLVVGKAIHCLLLDEHMFNQQFMVSPDDLPEVGKNRDVIDFCYSKYLEIKDAVPGEIGLDYFEVEILQKLKEVNLHQSLKTDPQRIDKMVTEKNVKYFEHLKIRDGKTLIDAKTMEFVNKAVNAVRNHPQVSELLGLIPDPLAATDVINEQYYESKEVARLPFGLKGILDNVIIDHPTKTIRINDLKTTSGSLIDFLNSVTFYRYDLQAAIYDHLVRANILAKLESPNEWNIKFTFVVVDSYLQVYPFEVSSETMATWYKELDTKLDEAKFHYETKQYNLPYAFLNGSVKL